MDDGKKCGNCKYFKLVATLGGNCNCVTMPAWAKRDKGVLSGRVLSYQGTDCATWERGTV